MRLILHKLAPGWITLIRYFQSPVPLIRSFVNPNVSVISICLLYKAVFGQDHPKWMHIMNS